MPGRYESWDDFCHAIAESEIDEIIGLAEDKDIILKSPSYFKAIKFGSLPCDRIEFPIPDFGVPDDQKAFFDMVDKIAGHIRAGTSVLVHCSGGIGRTGTFAICLLHCLGIEQHQAESIVDEAGSGPETSEQAGLVTRHAARA